MREQKANDNGFPVVGEQAKEQQIFPFEQLVEYDGATNKITINANVTINGDTNIGELDIDSGDAPKGQVLTADGDSGASWENRVEYLNLESESGNLTNAQIEVAKQDNVIITLGGQFYYKNSQSDEAIVFKAPAKVVDDDTIVEKIAIDLSDNTYSYSYEVVATGGSFDPTYDDELNDSSTNAVQNKVLTYKTNNLLPNIQGTSLRGLIVQLNSDNGVLLAEDNNHWYYWDGTQYKDGGLYQPIENNPEIEYINGKIDNLLIKSNDILKGIKTTNSSFHNENGYLFGDNYSAYLTTYPIPVKPNTTYKWYRNGVLHGQGIRLDALNIDKTFNSNIYSGQYVNTFTTPNDCYFIVLTSEIQYYYDETCIEDGQELVNEHLDINIIEDDSITEDKLATKPLQLVNNVVEDIFVDKTKVQSTNIDYTSGSAVSNANFVACNFIEIEPETTYHVMRDDFKISQVGNIAFYDANKQYISGQQSIWSDFTTPANAKYVRFSVYMSPFTQDTFTFENVKIVKGTSAEAINNIKLFKTEMFSKLNGKKWVVIGDSITEVNNRADLHYHDYIKSKNNMSVVNMGVGGTGYINRQAEDKAFYQRALDIPTDADIITVFGGVNDCLFATADIGEPNDNGTTTWCGCVNQLITNIRSLYLFAPLGIISPLPCNWADTGNESQYDAQLPSDETCRMSLFVEKLKKICELRGVPFLDLFHSSNMLPENSSFSAKYFSCGDSRNGDGLHPNSEGQKLFTSKIENFIKGIIVYDC